MHSCLYLAIAYILRKLLINILIDPKFILIIFCLVNVSSHICPHTQINLVKCLRLRCLFIQHFSELNTIANDCHYDILNLWCWYSLIKQYQNNMVWHFQLNICLANFSVSKCVYTGCHKMSKYTICRKMPFGGMWVNYKKSDST